MRRVGVSLGKEALVTRIAACGGTTPLHVARCCWRSRLPSLSPSPPVA